MVSVHGNFANGDFFIDCYISLSLLRALYGIWINIWIAGVAFCIRSAYRSTIKSRLLSTEGTDEKLVSLWHTSPPTSPFELWAMRSVFTRISRHGRGRLQFLLVSMLCLAAFAISSASTIIANHTAIENVIIRDKPVQGTLVTHIFKNNWPATVEVNSRIKALNRANAPYDEFFDFVPSDNSSWVFDPKQWNNTWKGHCDYRTHQAVDLTAFSTTSVDYQDACPSLSKYIPHWATLDRTKQGVANSWFYDSASLDSSVPTIYRDYLLIFAFGTAVENGTAPTESIPTTNLSFVNFLMHNVPVGPLKSGLGVGDSTFKTDVNVVDCVFDNAAPGELNQACADCGN